MLSRATMILSKRLPAVRLTPTTGRAMMSMYNPIKFDAIDPEKIFDEIDVDKNGTISREEFKAALSRLRYSDLMKIHKAAEANLRAFDTKLETLEGIEKDLDTLKNIVKQKQKVYNNVGMNTAADIDALFDESKVTRKRLESNVSELKGNLSHARDTYYNIGMTTAADLEELFKDHKKTEKAA
ncbi:MAG: hypothetical protein SGILL_008966 [Bacillariaceae sp.]